MEPKSSYYRRIFRTGALVFSLLVLVVGFLARPLVGLFHAIEFLYYVGCFAIPATALFAAGWRLRHDRRFGWHEAAALALVLLPLATYVYATHVEPYRLQVRHLSLEFDEIDEPLRLLHISDIQSDGVGPYERRAFERMRQIDPDLVIHSGDLLQPSTARQRRRLAELFRSLDPPLGTFNVPGDADVIWTDQMWSEFDRRAEIRTLHNDTLKLETPGGTIQLLGLSRPGSRWVAAKSLRDWIDQKDADSDDLHLVVGHAPDYILGVRETDIDLALAGHTHGGQIRIPFFGPPVTLSSVPRSWSRGHTRVDGIDLHVSPGIGAEHAAGIPSIRFNCPPRMTLITLE